MGICEEEELELSKEVHSLDLKNNEWHIAIMQIYENLFKEDAEARNARREIEFDNEGNYIEPEKKGPNAIEAFPTMSNAIRPLLEYIDGYRRRQAAPEDTLIRKKYSHYADLAYIQKRLKTVEEGVYSEIWRNNQVTVDYMHDEYYQN